LLILVEKDIGRIPTVDGDDQDTQALPFATEDQDVGERIPLAATKSHRRPGVNVKQFFSPLALLLALTADVCPHKYPPVGLVQGILKWEVSLYH
jgi:hypothetical protein